jgi:hypothetical protein
VLDLPHGNRKRPTRRPSAGRSTERLAAAILNDRTQLLADANAVNSQTQIAAVARATFNVEGTGISGRAIDVEWVTVGLLIVFVARKLAAGAHTVDPARRLDAFAARRTVGVKATGHGLRAGKR